MAAADPLFESLQRIPSMMESFDEEPEELRTSGETSGENKENKTSKVTGLNPVISSFSKVLSRADVRSEIKILCDKADGRGLRNYVIDNMKKVKTLRKELPLALREAPDVAKLAMNALEPPFSPNRDACILILKSFYKIFGNDESGVVPSYVKDSAREIVKDWRKGVIEKKKGRACRGKVRAFLRFLASLPKIAADCDRDDLWGLLLAVSSDATTPDLCRSLGLTPNVSEFIDKLSKSGKQIEALRYADAFGLLDKVDHVDLLTSYLRDVEKDGKEVVTNAQVTAASQTPDYLARLQSKAANQLRDSKRTVVNLVRKYGLQSHFFEDELRKLEQEGYNRAKHEKIAMKKRKLISSVDIPSEIKTIFDKADDRFEDELRKLEQEGYDRAKHDKIAMKERNLLLSVDIRSEIKTICDKADGCGLRNYIIHNMKEVETLRKVLPMVLRKAADVAKLVVNALEPPFPTNRKACILLLECLYPIFGSDDSGVIPSDVKDSAREIAKAWRKEMKIEKNTGRDGRANIRDIRAFLKFLASFRIAADYQRDELWELLLAVLSNVETIELCRRLGLSPNISEFIDKLSKSGKQIEALRYADAFGMLDKVDHVDLLTSYLRDVEKDGKEAVTNAQVTAASQTPDYLARLQSKAANKFRAAMRTVVNLVREYGLQSHFFEDELRKLEQEGYDRAKHDKIAMKERKLLSSVDIRSEIKTICDKADGHGLRNYIIHNMKEVKSLRNELSVVLHKAADAAKLVMNALEPPFSTNRKACILLLECLYPIFGSDDSGVIPSDVKDSAREIAKAWRKEMKIEKTTGRAGRANIRAFLKFLASFRIAADYERDELWGLLLAVLNDMETIELCWCLGLSPNISEFIDKLSKSGKYIEALKYADAFGLLDKVDHVDLLTSYLRDVERAGKEVMMIAQGTTASQTPDNMARLQSYADIKLKEAMRVVIKLVRKYGLQSHFFEDKLRKLEQKKEGRIENNKIAKKERKKAATEKEEQEDGKKAAGKKAQEKKEKDGKKAAGKKSQEKEEQEDGKKADEKKAQEKEDGMKAAEKKAQEKEDGKKAAEKKAQEKEDGKKAAEKKAQEKEEKDGKKAAEKKAQEKEEKDGKKDAEKKAQEKEEQEDREKDAEKKAQHKRCQSFDPGYGISETGNYASKRAKHASLNETTRVAKKKAEQEEDGKKSYEKKAEQEEDGKKAYEKKAQEKEDKEDRKKAAEKKVQEKEDGKKDVEKKAQHKRRQSFEPGHGLSERENYASKRAKDASLNETTRVASGIDNSKSSPFNIDGVQNKYGIIGHDRHTSAFSAANTGLAAGAFASAPSIAAQINNERRRHEGYPLAFGTSNRTPIGSSLYSSSVPAGAFAFLLPNVAEVNYEGRGQQSYTMNFGEVDKNHVRTSVYGTGDLANSFATQSNYNLEGRGEESYQLNFGEIRNNPVRQSAYVTGVSSATQCHYERRVPELYTPTFGGGNTAGIVSSLYGSNPRTIPSVVNQGSHESSGYESGVSTVPPSSVSQDHFERKGSVIDRYRFNSG